MVREAWQAAVHGVLRAVHDSNYTTPGSQNIAMKIGSQYTARKMRATPLA